VPAGFDADGVADFEAAGGGGDGFVCTCTSAATSAPPAMRAVARDNQNLNMSAYAPHASRFRKQFFGRAESLIAMALYFL
jgi:hypothetical protein